MGNSTFWFFPTDSTIASEVDLGARILERGGPWPVVRQSVSESWSGSLVTTHYGGRFTIEIQHTFDSRNVGKRRLLFGMINHLQRGGNVMFAEDAAFAFAGFLSILPPRLSTRIHYTANIFDNLVNAPNVAARELVIQSDPETFMAEMRLASAHGVAARAIDLSSGLTFPYGTQAQWGLVREYGSYPALRIPKDRRNERFLTHSHEQVFRLNLPLEEDPDAILAMMGQIPGSQLSESPYVPWSGSTSGTIGTLPGGWVI